MRHRVASKSLPASEVVGVVNGTVGFVTGLTLWTPGLTHPALPLLIALRGVFGA